MAPSLISDTKDQTKNMAEGGKGKRREIVGEDTLQGNVTGRPRSSNNGIRVPLLQRRSQMLS